MRIGIMPENIIDHTALVSDKLPIPLLETFWGAGLWWIDIILHVDKL
jgi:hypothetical protein